MASSSSSSSSSSCSTFLPRNIQSWMAVLVPPASLFFAMVSAGHSVVSISITSLALLISSAIMALKPPKPISNKNQNQGEISSEIKKVATEEEEEQQKKLYYHHDSSSSSEDYSDIDSIVRCSDDDGSISDDDEESLFEICLLPYSSGHEKESSKDLCLQEFLTDMNEEDNMIEIDISMGSIKCSGFEH